MSHHVSLAVAAMILATATVTAPAPAELVPWLREGDHAAALALAKKQKKLVFLDVYATWCGPCKLMDRQTYSDSTVGAIASAYYVNRKVDGEKGEGIQLAKRFNVNAYPTLIIVDGDGKEVNRAIGYRTASQFARFLDDTRAGRGTIDALEKTIAGGKDTYENRYALAEKYLEGGEFVRARENFEKAFTLDPEDKRRGMADALYGMGRAERNAGNHEKAIGDFQRFLEKFPADPRAREVQTMLASSLGDLGKKDEAVATYRKVLETKPDDPAMLGAFARFCAGLKVSLDEAKAAALKGVELSDRSPQSLDALADVYAAGGHWDDGLLVLEEAARARPEDNALRGKMERFQEEAVRAVQARKQQ